MLADVYTSVVNIAVTGRPGSERDRIGSGIVYTSDGLILTNDHVVTLDGAVSSGQSIVVTFSDDTTADATIVGEDATHDIAAIKVAKTGLNPIKFSTAGPMELGEWAIVIGSPLDFRNSVTLGIVSGLRPHPPDLSRPASPDRTRADRQPHQPGELRRRLLQYPGRNSLACLRYTCRRAHRSGEHRLRHSWGSGPQRGQDPNGQIESGAWAGSAEP